MAEERPAARLTYSYDDNGNLEVVDNDEALTTYAWDLENHMTGVQLPDSIMIFDSGYPHFATMLTGALNH